MGTVFHLSHIGQKTDLQNIQRIKKLVIKRTTNPIKNGDTDLNRER